MKRVSDFCGGLPEDYLDDLKSASVAPLWPSLGDLLPRGASTSGLPAAKWDYNTIKPLLLRSAEITTVEQAERRVLVLENPANGRVKFRVAPGLYAGFQIILPGERAINHKHTPLAVRLAVEGEGAYTLVNGVKCVMEPGDLILTPPGMWHEHGHEGKKPAIWLDILNLPLVHYMGCSFSVEGEPQSELIDSGEKTFRCGAEGFLPHSYDKSNRESSGVYPMLRYSWQACREELNRLSLERDIGEGVLVDYVNPETGMSCLAGYRCTAMMLRPGETVKYKSDAGSTMVQVLSGRGCSFINGEAFSWRENDSLAFSSFAEIEHVNNVEKPSYLFSFDDSVLMKYLNISGSL